MKGRKKSSAKLILLKGKPGHYPINDREPEFNIGMGEPPEFLNQTEKKWWNYHAPELIEKGVLARVDIGIFMAFCTALADLEMSSKKLKNPSNYTQNGKKKSPWIMIRKQARDQLRTLGAELGLSPSSRTRVKATKPDQPQGAKRLLG